MLDGDRKASYPKKRERPHTLIRGLVPVSPSSQLRFHAFLPNMPFSLSVFASGVENKSVQRLCKDRPERLFSYTSKQVCPLVVNNTERERERQRSRSRATRFPQPLGTCFLSFAGDDGILPESSRFSQKNSFPPCIFPVSAGPSLPHLPSHATLNPFFFYSSTTFFTLSNAFLVLTPTSLLLVTVAAA